jgi:glucose-6-phosphate 1-dehydrogenase
LHPGSARVKRSPVSDVVSSVSATGVTTGSDRTEAKEDAVSAARTKATGSTGERSSGEGETGGRPETTLVIFGAGGDLTSRLVLPALGQLLAREPARRVRIVGASRNAEPQATWRREVRRAFAKGVKGDELPEAAERAAKTTTFASVDITDTKALRAFLAEIEAPAVLYFAVPPAVAASACHGLKPADLPDGTVLALEKPFGSDEASARELNAVLAGLVPETQVFRVDHFLGRSTTLNLLGARFANRVFESVWSAEHVESVVIRYDEALGLEGRAGYYDKAGALIDMIQSHLLQLLAFVAMDQPATLDEQDLRSATAAVLRATHVWDDNPVHHSRRARYTAGSVGDKSMPDYADEPGVDPARETETLAEATFEVRTARWTGVPFTLRSGKAIGDPRTEVAVRLRPVRHLPTGLTGDAPGSLLRFALGPDRIELTINVNGGEDPFALAPATLAADLGAGALLAYTEVLEGVLDGDPTLSVRGDSAEQCWRIVQPIIDAWRRGEVPLDEYAAGSAGPEAWPVID